MGVNFFLTFLILSLKSFLSFSPLQCLVLQIKSHEMLLWDAAEEVRSVCLPWYYGKVFPYILAASFEDLALETRGMMLFIAMPQSYTAAHRLGWATVLRGWQCLHGHLVWVGTLPEKLGWTGLPGQWCQSQVSMGLFVVCFLLSGNNLTNFCQGEIAHSFNKWEKVKVLSPPLAVGCSPQERGANTTKGWVPQAVIGVSGGLHTQRSSDGIKRRATSH